MELEKVNFQRGSWINSPEDIAMTADALSFSVSKGSDFWRQTHYGFTRASGHALLFDAPDRFAAELTFRGGFAGKYEQAGFLVWVDETRWIKFGIEFADGFPNLAAVVTRGASDWSMAPAPSVEELRIRLTISSGAVLLHAKVGELWQIHRVANFEAEKIRIGPMACAPETSGLSVSFRDFTIGPVPAEPLYLNS